MANKRISAKARQALASSGVWPALPLTGCWFLAFSSLDTAIPLPAITRLALWTTAGLAIWSPMLFIAAVAGVYRPRIIGVAGWIITVVFLGRLILGGVEREVFSGVIAGPWEAVLLAGVILSGWLCLWFPTESILGENDAGVYANHAIYLARHGRLDIPYPWAGETDKDLARTFHAHRTLDGSFFEDHLFPGFFKTGKTLTVQFAHLFPVWLAQAFASFGSHGLFRLNGVFSLLTLGIFYGLCFLLMPAPFAVVATLFLAWNAAQIWTARLTLSEILTQLFIWSGLLLLTLAIRCDVPDLGCLAGAFLGLSAMVRCDCALLAALLFMAQLLGNVMVPGGGDSAWSTANGVMLPLLVLSVGSLWLFSKPYFQKNIRSRMAAIALATLVAWIALFACGPDVCRRLQPWATSPVGPGLAGLGLLGIAVYGFWIRPRYRRFVLRYPGHPYNGMRYPAEKSLVHFAAYLSFPGLWLGFAGWFLALCRLTQGRPELHWLPVLVVVAGYSAAYLYDPADDPFHFWLMRRYIPVVLPGFVLFGAVASAWLLGNLSAPWPNVGAAVLLIGVAAFAIRSGDVLLLFAERKGLFKDLETLARAIPDDEIILANAWPDLLTPLCVAFDKKVIPINLATDEGQAILTKWVARRSGLGKPIYILQQSSSGVLPPRTTETFLGTLSFSYLKPSVRPLPRHIEKKRITVALQCVDGLLQPGEMYDVPLERGFVPGVRASGFYREEWFEGEAVRWTNGRAKVMVPVQASRLPKGLIVDICWPGPHAPRLQIVVNGRRLCETLIPLQQSWSARLDLVDVPVKDELKIELLSDTFLGSEKWDLGDFAAPDCRLLGVLVRSIVLVESLDSFGVRLENGTVWGSKLNGFHNRECVGGRPSRWTDGKATLVIPLDSRRLPQALDFELATCNPRGTVFCLRANGRDLCRDGVGPECTWSRVVRLPDGLVRGERMVIELLSDTFVPSEVSRGAMDDRRLGLLVRKICLAS